MKILSYVAEYVVAMTILVSLGVVWRYSLATHEANKRASDAEDDDSADASE